MVIVAFKCLAKQLLLICGIIAVCAGLTWCFDGLSAAHKMIQTAVWGLNGTWVWTFGWGLAGFVSIRGRLLPAALDGVLVSNKHTTTAHSLIERSTLHSKALYITVPITLFGVFLTHMYQIPVDGLAHWLIFVGVCAIYYVGAFLLFHFVTIIRAFDSIANAIAEIEFKRVYSPIHLDTLTSYLAMTTTLGLISIYAGFRGTLTAGFLFHGNAPLWQPFLVTPLVLFLPGTLFYNYFPCYVLRKVVQFKVLKTMERLGNAEDHETRSLFLDLRDNVATSSQILPFLDYKTAPSYLLAIGAGFTMIYHDPAIKTFVFYIINLGPQK